MEPQTASQQHREWMEKRTACVQVALGVVGGVLLFLWLIVFPVSTYVAVGDLQDKFDETAAAIKEDVRVMMEALNLTEVKCVAHHG